MEFTVESKKLNKDLDDIFTKKSKSVKVATYNELINWLSGQNLSSDEKVRDVIYTFLTNSNIAGGYKRMLINQLNPDIIYRDNMFINVFFELYNKKQLQAYEIIGINRFKVDEEFLYKVITNEFFNSGYTVPISGHSYSDANLRAVLLYHSDVVSIRIIKYLCNLVDSANYKGKIDMKRLKKYVISKCPDIIKEDSTLQLYFDLV